MKKLLITYATRPFSMRVVELLSDRFEVIVATSDEVPDIFRDRYRKIPKGANPTYAHEILKIALDSSCDYILPLGIDEIETLSASLILFEEYGIKVLCPGMGELVTISVLENPTREMPLSLVIDGQDVLRGLTVTLEFNGLGLISDSGESFILAIAK